MKRQRDAICRRRQVVLTSGPNKNVRRGPTACAKVDSWTEFVCAKNLSEDQLHRPCGIRHCQLPQRMTRKHLIHLPLVQHPPNHIHNVVHDPASEHHALGPISTWKHHFYDQHGDDDDHEHDCEQEVFVQDGQVVHYRQLTFQTETKRSSSEDHRERVLQVLAQVIAATNTEGRECHCGDGAQHHEHIVLIESRLPLHHCVSEPVMTVAPFGATTMSHRVTT